MGHEVTGEVVEVGDAVKTVQKGDSIVSAFTTSWYVTHLVCYDMVVWKYADTWRYRKAEHVSIARQASRLDVTRMHFLDATI